MNGESAPTFSQGVAPGNGAQAPPRKWLVFSLVAAGVFMSTLDSSIVNIALPVIMADFGVPLTLIEWVPMIYLLTVSPLLLTCGRLSDIRGRRGVYCGGFVIFNAAFRQLNGGQDLQAYDPSLAPVFMAAFQRAMTAGAGVVGFGVLVAWLRGPDGGRNREGRAADAAAARQGEEDESGRGGNGRPGAPRTGRRSG